MIKKALCVVAIAAQMACAGAVPRALAGLVSPSTQPSTPVESFSTSDLPLRLSPDPGELLQWLKPFDTPLKPFDYTLQLIESGDTIDVYKLVYPSPFNSPYPQNNIVPAEFYVPKQRNGKVPAAIVLDILYGNAIVPRSLARGLASQGVAAVYVPMAYYNARRPKGDPHLRWFSDDPARTLDPVRQTVMDIRRAKAILADRPEVDSHRIGITGVSLGGIMTSIAAGVDGDFYRVVPILAGGNLADLIFHAPEMRKVREKLVAQGIDEQKLEPMVAPVEPLNFAPRIDTSRVLMINARQDEVIPKMCTTELWNAIGKPTLLWIPSGHYTAAFYLPTIKQTAIDFLKGEPVQRLEY